MEKLTVQEEEAMQVIWQLGVGFIRDILDNLSEPKPPYTTLASTVRNLERKKFVVSEKIANSHRYRPLIKEADYKKKFIGGFVNDYFKNSYKDLVMFFADQNNINAKELEEVIKLINNSKS